MRSTLLSAAVLSVLTSAIATAQTAPAPASAPSAEGSGDLLDVVVTARRREESLKDVPIAVTAVSGETIKDQQLYAVKDIALYSPGVNINSDSVGRAFVSIRGIGTTLIDTVQPGVGIFIDGIYEPNTSYLMSPLLDVARVEVLRGPQGTLFGNNTLGGAINVITRQPGNAFEARVDAAYANADDFESLAASLSGPLIDDVLQVRVGAAYHNQDGFTRNTLAGGWQNALRQKSANATVRFKPADWAQFTLNMNYDSVFGGSVPYAWSTGPTDYSESVQTNELSQALLIYHGISLKGEFNADSIHSKITTIASYNMRDGESHGDGDFGPIDFIRATNDPRLSTTTGEIRLDTTWSDSVTSLIGVYSSLATTHAVTSTTLVPLNLTVGATGIASNSSQAVFATVFDKLSPTWDLAVGLRFDQQDLKSNTDATPTGYKANFVDPRVTLTKHFTPDVMGYASIARGSRGGGENGPGAPNPIYKGDSVWTYELGTKFNMLEHRLEIETDVFYNDYSDYIGQNALAPSTLGPGFVAINLNEGKIKSYGAELELNYRPTDNWRLYSGLTLLHARVTDQSEFIQTTGYALPGDRVLFVPDWNFNLGTNVKVPLGAHDSLIFDASVIGKGDRTGSSLDANSEPVMPSYYLVNSTLAWQHDNFTLGVFGTNLADEKYQEVYLDKSLLSRAGLPPFLVNNLTIQGDRRRIGVRASYRF
jgi:iron complex outermembrane receptor protein